MRESDIDIDRAGAVLVDLAGRNRDQGKQRLQEYEINLLQRSKRALERSTVFKKYLVESLRAALQTENHEIVYHLLKDIRPGLLSSESDLLPIAVSEAQRSSRREMSEPVTLRDTLRILVVNGADVNGLDDTGRCALTYCCIKGFQTTFRYLIDAGADVSMKQPRGKNQRIEDQKDEMVPVNLLQIAVDARFSENYTMTEWTDSDERWTAIIMILLDAGLRIDSCDQGLVALFYAVCYQGYQESIEKIIAAGVSVDAPPPDKCDSRYKFGSALHAAIVGRNARIVQLLIETGADTRAVLVMSIYWDNKKNVSAFALAHMRLEPRYKPRHAVEGSPGDWEEETHFESICEALLDAGLSGEERKLLLQECATHGYERLLRRLLKEGYRVKKVPLPKKGNIQVIQLLLDSGSTYDAAEMQENAAQGAHLALLEYLHKRDGPCIRTRRFISIIHDIILRNDLPTLRFLITDYGYDVNKPFRMHWLSRNSTNLGQIAIAARSVEAMQLLLNHGLNLRFPALRYNALDYFEEQIPPLETFEQTNLRQKTAYLLLSHGSSLRTEEHWSLKLDPGFQLLREYASDIRQSRMTGERPKHVVSHVPSQDYTYPHPYPVSDSGIPAYEYQPLGGIESTRVMELLPSLKADSPIHCRLIEVDLHEKPEYEALSYVWGDPVRKVTILVNDCRMEITQNLWSALFRLRMKTKPRVLWADAICIHQASLEEREQQVRIMRDIYQSARRVLIWLGEHADNSKLLFWTNESAAEEDQTTTEATSSIEYPDRIRALTPLVQRPWFSRTWTIQEALLNKAKFICGSNSIDFTLLGRFSEEVLEGVKTSWFQHLFNESESLQWDLDPISRFSQLQDLLSEQTYEPIIDYSRQCQATDPKDKVYGILGLLADGFISIDYTVSVAEVYRRFTQAVIERTRSLRLLHQLGLHRTVDDLPSWVPDFNSKPQKWLRGFSSTWLAGDTTEVLPGIQFLGSDLIIKGKYLATIDAVGDELPSGCAPGDKVFSNTFRTWEKLATQQKRVLGSTFETFGRTILGKPLQIPSHDTTLPSEETFHFLLWYFVYGTGILKQAEAQYVNFLRAVLAWSPGLSSQTAIERDIDKYTKLMGTVPYGRRFIVTKDGIMGLASVDVEAGDQIVYFPGGKYPFVIRSCSGGFQVVGDCYLSSIDPERLYQDGEEVEEYILR